MVTPRAPRPHPAAKTSPPTPPARYGDVLDKRGTLRRARVIMNPDEMRRAIARIAHEIIERTDGAANVVLVGLYAEGIPIAERLAAFIQAFEGRAVPVGRLDFSTFRDDVRDKGPFPSLGPTELPASLTGMTVILVDDVLYTGRSLRAGLDALFAHGRPARVQAAVLVDRGHRELPLRADYVGKNLPTASDEWVQVQVQELHGQDGVFLVREEGDEA
jgi:pyrimidine operon attenuation protein/uracil phosphoribosyltransferase